MWYMKICLRLVELIETADQLPGLMKSWWILLKVLNKINLHA